MKAAKLHGARDFCIEEVPAPMDPGPDEVIIRIGSVGVCGSDLHTYENGHIGNTYVEKPMILGHEFAGTITAIGAGARDGEGATLSVGQRVAVEPSMACWHCDRCDQGHPNLCRNLSFMGLYPDDGALQEYLTVPARCCFPLPDTLSMDAGALLEPLGVAIHAVDLGKLKVAESVAVLGCGPIGLLIVGLAKLAGAAPIYAVDQHDWRLEAAKTWGADVALDFKHVDPVAAVHELTGGRGATTVFEAAWAGDAVDQAMQIADLGGRVVLVGIPSDDSATFTHSNARRKGLSIMMVRRMKHTYPRATQLALSGAVDVERLVTHTFALEQTADAFALNLAYADKVIKAMIRVSEE